MDALALSPRRLPSSSSRTGPKSLPPSACVDVQWKFLPPHSVAAHLPPPRSPSSHRPPTGRLLEAIENGPAREELHNEQLRQRQEQETRQLREQSVLYDLMGETQRQAMLDKVMAEMEAMALTPVKRLGHKRRTPHGIINGVSPPASATRRSSAMLPLTQRQADAELLPQRRFSALGYDDDPDNDGLRGSDEDGSAGDVADGLEDDLPELRMIRERHRKRMQARDSTVSEIPRVDHVLWQKSSTVRAAMDLPPALLQRLEVADNDEVLIVREEANDAKRGHKSRSPPNTKGGSPARAGESAPPTQPSTLMTSPRSNRIHKAHYGAWYVPQQEWWPLHRSEQEMLAELYPNEQPPAVVKHECSPEPPVRFSKEHRQSAMMSPHAWPSLLRMPMPPSSPATRASSFFACTPTTPTGTSRLSSPSYSTPGNRGGRSDGKKKSVSPDEIAVRASELEKEIPQAYIAREYRSYLQAKNARLPRYLNY